MNEEVGNAPSELTVRARIAAMLPRKSGELVFEAPWEREVFGMAIALCEKGVISFDELRWRVVAAISAWERANRGQEDKFRFYAFWLDSLERLLLERGVLKDSELKVGRRENQSD